MHRGCRKVVAGALSKYDSPSLSSLGRTNRSPIFNPMHTGRLYTFSSVRYILPSHIPHSSFHSIPFLSRFASFRYPSVRYGHICPPPVSSILVYMYYATLPHIYGLLSPFSFSYISSIHCCMYSPF